ncbi:MAG: hypothetical protein QW570_08685 [Candidatus Caldarchaeum sp.]
MQTKQNIAIKIIGGLFIASLLSCRSPAPPMPSGIVFFRGNESQGALYFYEFSTGKIRLLTPPDQWIAPYYPYLISWSKQNWHFAYVTGYNNTAEIYTLALDGTIKRLTYNQWEDHSPQWSPNGQTLAFLSRKDDGMERAYIMNFASGEVRPLLPDKSILTADLRWSPQGDQIALSAVHAQEQPQFLGQIQTHYLYIVNPETGEIIKKQEGKDTVFDKLSWSPDGHKVAYVAHTAGRHELRIWDLEKEVVYPLSEIEQDVWLVEWAPKGLFLAVFAGQLEERNPTLHLYIVNAEGKDIRDITPAGISVIMGRPGLWSPDSSCLLVTTYEETGQWAIRIIHWPTGRDKKIAGEYPFAISLLWITDSEPPFSCESLFK